MNSKIYYGIDENTWNNLCFKAEDLLSEKDLGTHIVGLYPVKGDRSGQACIFCLYIDSVESLLDPTQNISGPTVIEDNHHIIIMYDLYAWVRHITNRSLYPPERRKEVPFEDVIYENESISDIIHATKKYVSNEISEEEVGKKVVELYRSLI
jgi:hypothetical protein